MRLIDADALIEDITYSADMGGALGKVVECVKYYAKYMIATAPTIEERKKGKWLLSGSNIFPFECDQCSDTNERRTSWCPHCGADMREKP